MEKKKTGNSALGYLLAVAQFVFERKPVIATC
jgi:hypothetical protein